MRYAKNGVTVSLYYDNRKMSKDNTAPIKVRVTYQRSHCYIGTGKHITPDQWKKFPTGRSNEYLQLRKDVEETFTYVRNIVDELGMDFTFETLNARVRRGDVKTLNELFRAKIADLEIESRVGSVVAYRGVLKRIEAFAGDKIPLLSVGVGWCNKFTKHLISKDYSATTIAITMRHLRAVLNEAKRLGMITVTQYPFGRGRYEIQESEGRKLALTLEQIGEIARYDDGSDVTAKYRDYWLFLYLCNGINMADFVTLRYKDMVNGEMCFMRLKTAKTSRTRKEIRVVITDVMQSIIDRWGVKPATPNTYIFGCLDGGEDAVRQKQKTQHLTRNINKRMAKIGIELGFGSISTYTARHSFATVLKRAGASIAYISESLGHSDLRTTEHYLASFEREEREKNAELLTRF